MKHEGNIYAGTFDEFREFIIDRIYEDCQNERHSSFKGYNIGFCPCETDVSEGLEKLNEYAEQWYGIKLLDSYFDPLSERQFYSDYYSGGSFGCCDIYLDDLDRDYVAREVEKMISTTFYDEHGSSICVWEAME